MFLFLPPLRRWRSSGAAKVVSYVRNTAEELTGQTKVALAQAEVREKREELKTWRLRVSEASSRHEDTQQRLRHVYAFKTQLYQAQRRDLAALQAINSEEESLLSEEQSHSENLESLKQSERECFDALGDAILASHEKERAQSEKMKYYSRLSSVVGAIVGFAGSNFFLRREVRTHQRLQVEKIESVEQTLRQLVLQCDPSSATTTTEDSTVELRTLILEEGEKQTTLLGDIRNRMALCNTEDTVDNSTLVVGTGAAIFALSFAIFAAIAALNGSR